MNNDHRTADASRNLPSGASAAQPVGAVKGVVVAGAAARAAAATAAGPVGTVIGAPAAKDAAKAIDPAREHAYWRKNFSGRDDVEKDSSFDNYGPAVRTAGAQPRRGAMDEPSHPKRNCMNTPMALIALSACLLSLGACDETPTKPPTPTVNMQVPTEIGAMAGPVADPSVPSAASVISPPTVTKSDPTLGRSNSTMSAVQESSTMPMPGQSNDHSAPLGPAKSASAP